MSTIPIDLVYDNKRNVFPSGLLIGIVCLLYASKVGTPAFPPRNTPHIMPPDVSVQPLHFALRLQISSPITTSYGAKIHSMPP